MFTRKTGTALGLLSFRPNSCLPLLELLKMSGNPLSLREKEMVMSCVQFFEEEKAYRKKIHGNHLCHCTAEALGVSERAVYRVKKNKSQSNHAVDKMAGWQGFHVLHLPVGYCELNPIERIWAQIKGEVAKKNIMFCLKDVQTLTRNAIENVTPENWP